jgi:hypothetical protein
MLRCTEVNILAIILCLFHSSHAEHSLQVKIQQAAWLHDGEDDFLDAYTRGQRMRLTTTQRVSTPSSGRHPMTYFKGGGLRFDSVWNMFLLLLFLMNFLFGLGVRNSSI